MTLFLHVSLPTFRGAVVGDGKHVEVAGAGSLQRVVQLSQLFGLFAAFRTVGVEEPQDNIVLGQGMRGMPVVAGVGNQQLLAMLANQQGL